MRVFLLKLIVRVVFPALAFPLPGVAGTSHGTAAGGPIPSGAFVTSGVVTSDIVLTDAGYVASGNAVTVNLLGLQHDFAGDLQITLSYIDSHGNVVQSVDLINRIGSTSANPYGSAADFGDNDDSGDNYQFNTDYSGDLWAVANCSDPPNCTTPYGDADSLPGVSTDTVNNGQYFTSTTGGAKTNLSYAFAGLSVSGGTWRLTIKDWADPNVGSYIGWEIYVTTAPTITDGGPSGASYVGSDSTTQGTWTGTYGTDGYLVANDATAPPSYASVSFNGDSTWTWDTSSTELRDLQTASGAARRIASQYYSYGSFTVNVNLTDGNSHRVALYLLDWDTTTRSETITITDAISGAVLNTQNFSNFNQGVWAVWNLKGNVIITVTNTGPMGHSNATISGIFFGAPTTTSSASYSGTDSTTQGTWTGTYGGDGYLIANESAAAPSYASVSFNGDSTWTWATSSTELRDLQTASGAATRIASQYYSYGSFTVNVNLTDGNSHRVALYLLDWDTTTRSETVTITDAISGAVLNTQNFSNFNQGVWAVWNLKGNVIITVTNTGPVGHSNATISGIFFGAPTTTSSASYGGTDTTTQGTWTGTYGADGYLIANESTAPPSYATVSFNGDSTWTWDTSSTELRDLQTASGAATRIASQYYSYGSFTVNLDLTDGNTHRVALYLLDWDTTTRSETITITDVISGAVLNTQNLSNFNQGVWAVWNLKGNVIITVTNTGPVGHSNATVSGIFFN